MKITSYFQKVNNINMKRGISSCKISESGTPVKRASDLGQTSIKGENQQQIDVVIKNIHNDELRRTEEGA